MRDVHKGTIMSDYPKKYFVSPSIVSLFVGWFSAVATIMFVAFIIDKYKENMILLVPVGTLILLTFISYYYVSTVHEMKRKYDILVSEIVREFVHEGVIISTLKARAQGFHNACQRQTDFHANGKSEGDLSEVLELVKKRKEEFWAAHTLARKLGFTVRDKVGDYLNNG